MKQIIPYIIYKRLLQQIIFLPLSLLLANFFLQILTTFQVIPVVKKPMPKITENCYFPNIKLWIAILTQDCLNRQTSKSMQNLLVAPQQPFLKVSPYYNQRISVDTKSVISPSSDGNSYVYVIVDAFTHFVVLHCSPKNDATNALSVLFDHWIGKFEKPNNLVTDNGNECINGEITHFCST